MTEADQPRVRSIHAGGIADIWLARPERRNAMDMPLVVDLHKAVIAVADAQVIALRADGDHFSVGGDVGAFAAAVDTAEFIAELAAAVHEVVRELDASRAVVIAGVRGWATGVGFSFVLGADLVVAAESARFKPAYPGVGLSPDGGMSWTLPRIVGRQRALEILLTDATIDAQTALELGIVTKVVPDADLDAEVDALAQRIAASSAVAMTAAKRLVHDGLTRSLTDHLDAEAASITACSIDADSNARIKAFGRK
jgi:2-(1,2-epoxy-1,2-dihydrophenyl)acetyl-CoA isomerase